nr:DUF1254 domain-containing protein [Microbacterium bovistercoris]
MNRLILKYAVPVVIVILVIFAWVVYRRLAGGWHDIVPLAVAAAVVWVAGTVVFIVFWPRITIGGFKRAILKRGMGDGPIPVNTLYAAPRTSSASAAGGSLLATGTDDVLYVAGWLDVTGGPQVLHTPDMADRYYSVQFTDPSTSANFAYLGTRTTGSRAGDYLITGPGWTGIVPADMTRISAPGHAMLVIGRVFVADDADVPAAHALATQLRVTPLDGRAAG